MKWKNVIYLFIVIIYKINFILFVHFDIIKEWCVAMTFHTSDTIYIRETFKKFNSYVNIFDFAIISREKYTLDCYKSGELKINHAKDCHRATFAS